ncbi:MAG: hypothetical protein OIF47_12735 [Marinibacterium sp.]|nr:hypothetical protein [Marinibacterium sp.]
MLRLFHVCAVVMAMAAPSLVAAQVKLEGTFTADRACEATQKLSSGNPGGVQTRPGQGYEVLGLNRQPPSHVWIRVPGAPVTDKRWVAVGCGRIDATTPTPTPAFRSVTISGNFHTTQSCPALKRTDAAPDGTVVEPGKVYGLVARSADDGFVRITHFGADDPRDRWVAAACGRSEITYDAERLPIVPGSIEHTLAASWQPGFCEIRAGQGDPGCASLHDAHPATRQFSLHGLWPDDWNTVAAFPCNCGGSGGPTSCFAKGEREPARISDGLRQQLELAMPGALGTLEDHEWSKHGTCYERFETGPDAGADAEEYFTDSLMLLDQLNRSAVQELFEDNRGRMLRADQIHAAFDTAFGPGAQDRVQIVCRRTTNGQQIIYELRIGLAGPIGPDADLGALIQAAPTWAEASTAPECSGGQVVQWR